MKRAGAWLGTAGGVLAVLAPKGLCPMCIAASSGVLSALGLRFLLDDSIMRWVLAGLLAMALLFFFMRARNAERWGLFGLAVSGSVLVYAGWFVETSPILYAGTVLLSAAAVLNLRKPRDETSLPVTVEGATR